MYIQNLIILKRKAETFEADDSYARWAYISCLLQVKQLIYIIPVFIFIFSFEIA